MLSRLHRGVAGTPRAAPPPPPQQLHLSRSVVQRAQPALMPPYLAARTLATAPGLPFRRGGRMAVRSGAPHHAGAPRHGAIDEALKRLAVEQLEAQPEVFASGARSLAGRAGRGVRIGSGPKPHGRHACCGPASMLLKHQISGRPRPERQLLRGYGKRSWGSCLALSHGPGWLSGCAVVDPRLGLYGNWSPGPRRPP
jgi:hypothetical protein